MKTLTALGNEYLISLLSAGPIRLAHIRLALALSEALRPHLEMTDLVVERRRSFFALPSSVILC